MNKLTGKRKKKPCKGCPFRKDNNLKGENPGGSSPEVYLGQSRGPFWLPCHADKNYEGKESDSSKVLQCAGAAIFRGNINIPWGLPKDIDIRKNEDENVFKSEAEFYAHYKKCTVEDAEKLLTYSTLNEMLEKEFKKVGF